MMPDGGSASLLCISFLPENLYRGVGLMLKLFKNDVKFKYPYPHKGHWGQAKSDLQKLYDGTLKRMYGLFPCSLSCRESPVVNHGCQEYLDRLNANETRLQGTTLDRLYEDMVYSGRRRRMSLQMVRQSILGRLSILNNQDSFNE